jgi:hypothetical protein
MSHKGFEYFLATWMPPEAKTREATKQVIAAGNRFDSYGWGWTPLIFYARHGDIDMVTWLLDHGANANTPLRGHIRDPLWFALVECNILCALALLRAGATSLQRLACSGQLSCRMGIELVKQHVAPCRSAALALLSPRLIRRLGLPRDVAHLIAHRIWRTRYSEEWCK